MRRLLIAFLLFAVPLATTASNVPTSAMFHDPDTGNTCGPGGQPGAADPAENTLKNRIADPGATTLATTVAEFRNLPNHPKASRSSSKWTADELAQFKQLEDVPVHITGYLLGVKSEGIESTNCKVPPTDKSGIDFHMWLIDTHDKDKDRSFSAVVEVTPRWREVNPGWTLAALQDLVKRGAQVRISGWRLYDYEHPEQLPASKGTNATRSTLWEIHPITKIEIATADGWVELGATAPAPKKLVKPKGNPTTAAGEK
jgi:hypothetical protein